MITNSQANLNTKKEPAIYAGSFFVTDKNVTNPNTIIIIAK